MNKNHIIGKVFLSMLLLTTSSFSKIFTVSNVAEFRKALEDSALNGEDDTIHLNPGTYKTTSDGLGTFTYNDEEKHSLKLTAILNTRIILDGDNTHRVFSYFNKYGTKLTLENITIQNGKATEALEDGAGVETNANKVIVDKCIFKNNIANWKGGGIHISSSKFTLMKDSSFINNESQLLQGGGVYSGSSLAIVINSTFEENKAVYGDGVFLLGSDTFIINSTFNKNKGESAVSVLKSQMINNIFSNNNKLDLYSSFNGNIKLYNNYIDYSKISSNQTTLIKKNNIHPSTEGDIKYINTNLQLSATSPAINKGMDIYSDKFKKLILEKDDISSESLSTTDTEILAIMHQLTLDKALNKRDDTPDLGAYEYDSTVKAENDTPTETPTERDDSSTDQQEDDTPTETSTKKGTGTSSTGYMFPLFVFFLILYRNRKKYLLPIK